uniref:Clarin 1 n=1 Tax=Coturnix japonica TaxID=93934 RepID=A0A8C2UAF1_COTJA
MPPPQKKILFCLAGVFSFVCALGTTAAIGTQLWVKGTILCKTGALLVNATGPELEKFIGEIQYGLFHGERVRQCGLGGRPFQFSFFPDLLKIIPASIHVSIILFCTVLIIFTLVAMGFFLYNAFGSPYETLHGPVGLYLWSFIACEYPLQAAHPLQCGATARGPNRTWEAGRRGWFCCMALCTAEQRAWMLPMVFGSMADGSQPPAVGQFQQPTDLQLFLQARA